MDLQRITHSAWLSPTRDVTPKMAKDTPHPHQHFPRQTNNTSSLQVMALEKRETERRHNSNNVRIFFLFFLALRRWWPAPTIEGRRAWSVWHGGAVWREGGVQVVFNRLARRGHGNQIKVALFREVRGCRDVFNVSDAFAPLILFCGNRARKPD